MQANELRIGNWVNLEWNRPIKWDVDCFNSYIKDASTGFKNLPDGYISDVIEPIPLTPELLEKAGFVFDDEEFYNLPLPNQPFRISTLNIGLMYVENIEDDQAHALDVQCAHLHQLQNLYFALTGEELEIEP